MTLALLTTHQLCALQTHADPQWGSAYWIDRANELGITEIAGITTADDLARFGTMSPGDLRQRPLWDYIPRRFHSEPHRLVIGQTGGTSGDPTWTAYLDDEFHAAFVQPFVDAAEYVGFPSGGAWLYVGPSGPHLIGQAARAIARATGSAEPFSVDLDPRWARKLLTGSLAAARYLSHVADQSMRVIDNQPVDVLFATPPVLLELAGRMTLEQRRRIRGVHYGGMAIDDGTLCRLQSDAFTDAVHLAGYGNTLLGCCLELATGPGRQLDYYPHGDRLRLGTIDEQGQASTCGRVVASRFDQSFLILNMLERDHAECVAMPTNAPSAFHGPGLRNPHAPAPVSAVTECVGLY